VIQNIWQDFLKIVREEVGSRVVETWFKAILLQHWDALHKEVHLQAPNTFVRNWIQQHYISLFQIHLGRLLHVEMPKVIFIDPIIKKQQKKKENQVVNDSDKKQNAAVYKAAHVIPFNAILSDRNTLKKSSPYKQYGYINQSYLFDTFIVGPNNSLACAAAYAVAEKPGFLYNPMFIYGRSGLGKTHLLHAIGNAIKKNHKNMSVLYQTADRFVDEFINAIRFNKIHKFQKKYKTIDVLLIDDIQFISNKEQTQEAFFHIFNSLYDSHKQIVFSSDTFPQNIGGIAERLRSRLACGLVTDIHVPTLETKIAILIKKANLNNEILSNEVAHFIALHVVSNVRELEGALIRVIAFAHLTKQSITLELAKKVLIRSNQCEKRTISFERIAKCVEKHYPHNLSHLQSRGRSKDLVLARQISMFFMKKLTDKSLRTIGGFLGGRDHTTVKYAIDKIQRWSEEYPDFREQLKRIEQKIIS